MDKNIQTKLQKLFVMYTKSLPEKLAQIDQYWQAQRYAFDAEKFKDFHRHIHSLCGSAGTYGYKEGSQAARQLEVYLKKLLGASALTAFDREVITQFILQLKEAFKILPSQNFFTEVHESVTSKENKIIYILEKDLKLAHELVENLQYAGYSPYILEDLIVLNAAMKEQWPVAILIDMAYLVSDNGQALADIVEKEETQACQIFSLIPDSELLSRLIAVRAGCNAFFQKPVDLFYLIQVLNQKCGLSATIPFRILIIDDSESLGEYYSLILNQAGMVAHYLTKPLEAFKEIETYHPDLLLIDIYMPECTGLELATVLRQENKFNKIPIIFLSTEQDKRKQLAALSLGGDDFLTKPISPAHLVSAVRARSQRAEVLNYYMSIDGLTGLLNHSHFLKRLELALAYVHQKNLPLSLVMIDIDHFKEVNDTYGHPFGDLVIKKLATLLTLNLRSQDIVARYGGEEFALVLPGSTAARTEQVVKKLKNQFAQQKFNTDNFTVTFSAGIAENQENIGLNALVNAADKALYIAKRSGRNRVVISEADNQLTRNS